MCIEVLWLFTTSTEKLWLFMLSTEAFDPVHPTTRRLQSAVKVIGASPLQCKCVSWRCKRKCVAVPPKARRGTWRSVVQSLHIPPLSYAPRQTDHEIKGSLNDSFRKVTGTFSAAICLTSCTPKFPLHCSKCYTGFNLQLQICFDCRTKLFKSGPISSMKPTSPLLVFKNQSTSNSRTDYYAIPRSSL